LSSVVGIHDSLIEMRHFSRSTMTAVLRSPRCFTRLSGSLLESCWF